MDKAEVQHKIEALKKQREQLVTQANLQLANLNGQIQALEELIAPKGPAEGQADADATSPDS
jgi:hypothetical protein